MTPRDDEILTALTSKVRFFSLEQIAREFWAEGPNGIRLARNRLIVLAGAGWLKKVRVLARPLLFLKKPVWEWTPESPPPDCMAISRQLKNRWKMPARETDLFLASDKARGIFGGCVLGKVKNLCQTTHDLHVSEMFLRCRNLSPELVDAGVGEDEISRGGDDTTIPDAYLKNVDGGMARVLEFGGSYSPSRVCEFHAYCAEKPVSYELW